MLRKNENDGKANDQPAAFLLERGTPEMGLGSSGGEGEPDQSERLTA